MVVANDAKDGRPTAPPTSPMPTGGATFPDANQADADYDAPNLVIVYNLENQRRLGTGFFGGGLVLANCPKA